ncbi:MAG: SDR family oxidoreductase [Betaproteobacteria bacterium]|jgi:3-oxoacyl-[acyl-carrier protein] reductase
MSLQHPAAAGRELAGQVALVTGGAKNIGRAISLALAEAGAKVAVNTLGSRADADAVVSEIRAAGGEADVFLADIADAAAVSAMGEAVIKRFGKIDILVLNASQRREILFKDMTFEDWRNTMSITLDGSFHCIKACLPSMLEHKGGNIITLGGDAVLLGGNRKSHNTTAKNGLLGLTRALSKELADDGIRVNCVSPGSFNTSRPAHRSERADAKGQIPLGRRGEPGEIASVVRFLCGPGGGYITGQILHVNGGAFSFA